MHATGLDPSSLQTALDGVCSAGIPGLYAEVRADDQIWSGASGVADLATNRPVSTGMRHRIGSLTKTFVATAVLQQAEQGQIDLDAPIGDHLARLVPGERSRSVTVRMLLNHTSGISDYLPYAFPSLAAFPSLSDVSPESIDYNRFRQFSPTDLITMGLEAPASGEPGGTPGVYSNTNYFLLGELLAQVTGLPYEEYVTKQIIEPAGLPETTFPSGPQIDEPHSRMYEALFGLIDPPADYSLYDMSWVGPGAALVSTMTDVSRFYAHLLAGRIVEPSSVEQMKQTVPVTAQNGQLIHYGLGLHRVETDAGTYWGSDGTVWGAYTLSLTRDDGRRQMTLGTNLVRWNRPDGSGKPQPHAIDAALSAFQQLATGGTPSQSTSARTEGDR